MSLTSKDQPPSLPLHEPPTPTPTTPSSQPPRAHHTLRTEAAAFLGEFIGTFMFLSLAFTGTQIALNATGSKEPSSSDLPLPDLTKLLYISLAFGASLAINVAIFADISGGKFNPAVTTALYLTRKIHWHRATQTIFSQLVASIAASAFISGLVPGPLTIGTTLSADMSVTRGMFLEALVTSQLVLTILMLEGGAAKPMYIGGALFVGHVCSVYYTGASLNPARSFGAAVVVGFTGYHWIYWVGPLLGAGVASAVYGGVGWLRRERVVVV
ncbi:aquaporin-like protein [Bipolaris maydis]|nr:aquaporin-like protein [Bipolaris maydis]KAJ6284739.1 aquaporin-like protein [Bipolaris maydis]